MKEETFAWLNIDAESAGQRLLGCEILSTINNQEVRVRIVETEAYDQDDQASHAYMGKNSRNQTMFTSAGHLYVYLSYGIHFCCNIVCGEKGHGSGVLIRAVEPIMGLPVIESRRKTTGKNTTNGPGKVTQALGITRSLDGHNLSNKPIILIKKPPLDKEYIIVTRRIGISKATHKQRRFYIVNNPYVSKK